MLPMSKNEQFIAGKNKSLNYENKNNFYCYSFPLISEPNFNTVLIPTSSSFKKLLK